MTKVGEKSLESAQRDYIYNEGYRHPGNLDELLKMEKSERTICNLLHRALDAMRL